MIYAYDQQAQMPVRDLFDTQMMAMAINAAKDMYDKQEQRIEKFRDKYGSFYSPTQSHMDFYNENFNTGKFLDDLYSRGIDPLRSAEGRAAVQQWINSRPIGELEQYKKSAETYQKFQDSIAELQSKGLYNQEFQDFVLNGKNINNLKRGEIWDVTAATPYQNLSQYTGYLFDKMEDELIESDPKTGLDWYGVSREKRDQALTGALPEILSTDIGRYHYMKSKKAAEDALGRRLTEAEATQAFKNNVLQSTSKYEHRTPKENPEYKRKRDYYYDVALDTARTNNDIRRQKELRKNTPGFDEKGNAIKGYTGDKKSINIFREAEARSTDDGKMKDYTRYVPGAQYTQQIDPVYAPKNRIVMKDSDTGEKIEAFEYDNHTMKNMELYKVKEDGTLSRRYITHNNNDDYTFIPTGNMKARWVNGKYEYFISGTFTSSRSDDNNDIKLKGSDNSGEVYYIPVKERIGVYE